MKTSLTSIELKQIVKELKYIEGGRIDKIYHPSKKHLILQLHVTGKGKTIIRVLVGKLMFKTELKPEAKEPGSFCLFLRKILGSSRIKKIEQVGNERIVKIEFDTKEKSVMYIELFGRGNIILCDSEDKILNVEEKQIWKDRTLKKDELYRYPKKEYDYSTINAEQLKLISASTKKEAVKLIAAELGIGGAYAEEICTVAKIDKNKQDLTDSEAKKIVDAIKALEKRKIQPIIVKKNSVVQDVVLFPIEKYKDLEQEQAKDYNQAIDNIYSEQLLYFEEMQKMEKYNERVEKAEIIIKEQEKTIKEMKKKIEKNHAIGEKIYHNYQLISEVIEELRNVKKKLTINEINKKLKGHKVVKRVSKDWTVAVELK
jgi:predicted ribosome quality control (RQC) complex YloA/Tae2 family protein